MQRIKNCHIICNCVNVFVPKMLMFGLSIHNFETLSGYMSVNTIARFPPSENP